MEGCGCGCVNNYIRTCIKFFFFVVVFTTLLENIFNFFYKF